MFKSKKLSLLMALVFAFTVIMPVGAAFAADEVKFSSSYNYITADKKQNAGTVTVANDVYNEVKDNTDSVYITLNLPEGVKFTNTPKNTSDFKGDNKLVQGATDIIASGSDYVRVEATLEQFVDGVTFDFRAKENYENNKLDINKDFAGNLQVEIEAVGVQGDSMQWSDSDKMTIAKVAGDEITITADSPKKVSAGGSRTVADITVEESQANTIKSGWEVKLTIDTDDVEFSGNVTAKGEDGITFVDDEIDCAGETEVAFEVKDTATTFPGTIKFEDIQLNIAPNVDDEIEITVEVLNDSKVEEDATVTVATVDDITLEVIDLEDNDTVAYAGQETELDVEFTVATTDGSDFSENAGDIITFTLNKGEFAENGVDVDGDNNVKFYDDNEAFYYTCSKGDDVDELEFSDFVIILDNDVEPGDITLTIGGDFGELDDIVIATTAKPYTVTADVPSIATEALGQLAGDIIITETDGGAIDKDELIKVELPSGVELSSKPKIEVVEGNGDASIEKYDDDYFVIKVDKESSSSKASEFRVYDVKYDTGKLALVGDVELKFYGDKEGTDGADINNDYDNFEDDSLMTTVVNATVVDGSVVTATFSIGDEGVAVKNGRTLVQVNTLCEVLGLQKSWDATNKIAYFVKSGTVVAFPIDKNEISINGNVIPVDQGGTIINDFTYATLRGLEMAFGGTLYWDNETKTATFEFVK